MLDPLIYTASIIRRVVPFCLLLRQTRDTKEGASVAQTVRSAHFHFNSDKIGRDPCYVLGPRFTRFQSSEWRPHFIALILRQTRDTEDQIQSVPSGGKSVEQSV